MNEKDRVHSAYRAMMGDPALAAARRMIEAEVDRVITESCAAVGLPAPSEEQLKDIKRRGDERLTRFILDGEVPPP